MSFKTCCKNVPFTTHPEKAKEVNDLFMQNIHSSVTENKDKFTLNSHIYFKLRIIINYLLGAVCIKLKANK